MTPFEILLLTVVLLVAGYALVALIQAKNFFVEPGKRERLVIQQVFTGDMDMLGPGTHYRTPWWKELERVDLNREQVTVNGDEIETSNQVTFLPSYRYDQVAGRPYYNEEHRVRGEIPKGKEVGDLIHDDVDNENHVTKEAVLEAVTRIDFPKRIDRVKEIVKNVMEGIIGGLTAEQLMRPDQYEVDTIDGKSVTPPIKSRKKLLEELAKAINQATNRKLTFVGLNIVSFGITNLVPKDPELKKAWEKRVRQEELLNAATKAMERSKQEDPDNPFTFREAAALGDPAYAQTVQAEAIRSAGKSVGEGLRNFGKG